MSSELGGLFLDIWQTQFLNIKEIVARDPVAARASWRELWSPLSLVCRSLRALVVAAVSHAADFALVNDYALPARPWPRSLVAFFSVCCFRLCDDPATACMAKARRQSWEKNVDTLNLLMGRMFSRDGVNTNETLLALISRTVHWPPALALVLSLQPHVWSVGRLPCRLVKWVCFWAMADATLIGGDARRRWDAYVHWVLRHMPVSVGYSRDHERRTRRRLLDFLTWDEEPEDTMLDTEDEADDSYRQEGPRRAYTVASFRRFCARYHGCVSTWARQWDEIVPWFAAFEWPDPALYPWARALAPRH